MAHIPLPMWKLAKGIHSCFKIFIQNIIGKRESIHVTMISYCTYSCFQIPKILPAEICHFLFQNYSCFSLSHEFSLIEIIEPCNSLQLNNDCCFGINSIFHFLVFVIQYSNFIFQRTSLQNQENHFLRFFCELQ